MRSWSISLALAAIATGCTSLLGLDPTVQDSDGDGIPDELDNCPELASSEPFFDSDGDGTGDACSACANPIGVDLDSDGYDDNCDRCIGPGPIGVDSDGDGLDDGCDPCLGGTGITGVTENLGGTGMTGIDANNDGIDDGCTVCFARSGIDIDNDGLDDACDACTNGPPHDEDGDGLDDGCDNCPADHNPMQEVTDDPIGSICDPSFQEPNFRVLFDPFLANSVRWSQIDAGWAVGGDVARAVGVDQERLSDAQIDASAKSFSVTTELELADEMSRGGILLVSINGGGTLKCEVASDGTVELSHSGTGGPDTFFSSSPDVADPRSRLRLVLRQVPPTGPLNTRWLCAVIQPDGTRFPSVLIDAEDFSFSAGLRADGDVTFRWFDVISRL